MRILVINCGSSSVKYQLIDSDDGSALAAGARQLSGDASAGHTDAVTNSVKDILAELSGFSVDAVGHRVAHGGEAFHDACAIDEQVMAAIEACTTLAPLHNPANLAGIRTTRELLPGVPQVAVFDTAFHARMPRRARSYAIDADLAAARGLRRYGFHGSSHAYVAAQAAAYLDRPIETLRLISCHLGNGASACAIEYGHSVETSMGMTPLEGLVMGTRCGDLDPGLVIALARDLGIDETDRLLNCSSGLAGMSGGGNDLRDIEARAADGDDRARLAIAVFAHRVRKYIGAYAAVLGGVDAVIMTGGIGENSASMRRRILQRFEFLGLRLHETRNQDARVSHKATVADVSAESSGVRALVIASNEELRIAQETHAVVGGAKSVHSPGPIPIAISARHIHLNRQTMDTLFGKGSELTVYKEISQPGQFASGQRVSLIGPRGRIDGVRVLGPLRAENQIEISRTDEFGLGVDAPIRRSGQVEGSAPITLETEHGRVELGEGLICARRHIHMTPEDARAYGVTAGDEVEVAVNGGPRDLIFGDVLVRVNADYRLEMHIDTDEANAAELSPGAAGDLAYSPPVGNPRATLRSKRG